MNADAQLIPTEGALVDVRNLGSPGSNKKLQTDGRHGGDQRQQERKEDDLPRLREIDRFAPLLEEHRPKRGSKRRPAAPRFVEPKPGDVRRTVAWKHRGPGLTEGVHDVVPVARTDAGAHVHSSSLSVPAICSASSIV